MQDLSQTNPSNTPLACQNCDWTGTAGELPSPEITDLYERVYPGELMPWGECPECGSLLHEAKADPKPADVPPMPRRWAVPVVFTEKETYSGTAFVDATSADEARRKVVEEREWDDFDTGKNLGGEGMDALWVDDDRGIAAVD